MGSNYSQITRYAVSLYKGTIAFIWFLFITSLIAGFVCTLCTDNNGFLGFMFNLVVYTIEIISFVFPLLFMILYPILLNNTWKYGSALPLKPIILFGTIQLFNFFIIIYPLRFHYNAFSNEFSLFLFVFLFFISGLGFYLFIEWAKNNKINQNFSNNLLERYKISHYLYVGIIAVFIALLVDLNFYTNLSLSCGILLGGSFALVFQPDKEWKKIILYFFSPEFYNEVYDELELENEKIRDNYIIETKLNTLSAKLNNSISYTKKKKTYIATILIDTKSDQIKKEINNIEEQINLICKQFLSGAISQSLFDSEISKLTIELNNIQKSLGKVYPSQLLD